MAQTPATDAVDSGDSVHSLLIEQAARLMGVSRRTVYYRIRDGRLTTIRTRGGTQRVVATSLEVLRREGERKKRAAPSPADAGDRAEDRG